VLNLFSWGIKQLIRLAVAVLNMVVCENKLRKSRTSTGLLLNGCEAKMLFMLMNDAMYARKRTNKHKFYINNRSILLTSSYCQAYGTVFAVRGTT
jgi:hypothetical protein